MARAPKEAKERMVGHWVKFARTATSTIASELTSASWFDEGDGVLLSIGLGLLGDAILVRHGDTESAKVLELSGITLSEIRELLKRYYDASSSVRSPKWPLSKLQ